VFRWQTILHGDRHVWHDKGKANSQAEHHGFNEKQALCLGHNPGKACETQDRYRESCDLRGLENKLEPSTP
jgi:hypothetical protein